MCIRDRNCRVLKTYCFWWNRLRERASLPATIFFVKGNFVCLANDNSRKFKQNQIMFRIQPWIVVLKTYCFWWRSVKGRGSLPAIFYVWTNVFSMANDNSRKFKQNHIIFYLQPWFVEYSRPVVSVSYTHLDVYKRQVCVCVCVCVCCVRLGHNISEI